MAKNIGGDQEPIVVGNLALLAWESMESSYLLYLTKGKPVEKMHVEMNGQRQTLWQKREQQFGPEITYFGWRHESHDRARKTL